MQKPNSLFDRRTLLKVAGAGAIAPSLVLRDLYAQTGTPLKLTTGLKLANYGPLYVAQRSGLFEKQGLKLEGSTPQWLGNFTKDQLGIWKQAFDEAGLKPE